MSKSFIICSTRESYINEKIDEFCDNFGISNKTADFLLVLPGEKKQSIGIEKTRLLKEWFIVKPYNSPNKFAVIKNAELLTIEAQNSILKLLEEPNENCFIALTLSNPANLLPTVLSRCELIQDPKIEILKELSNFMKLSKIEQFKFIDEILSEKNSVEQNKLTKSFLLNLLKTLEKELKYNYFNDKLKENIALVLQTSIMISGNTSKRLALENMVINMKY